EFENDFSEQNNTRKPQTDKRPVMTASVQMLFNVYLRVRFQQVNHQHECLPGLMREKHKISVNKGAMCKLHTDLPLSVQ
ncbi:mCG146032, partial [Mus musculus]